MPITNMAAMSANATNRSFFIAGPPHACVPLTTPRLAHASPERLRRTDRSAAGDQHRAAGVADDVIRDAAEDHALHPRPAARADDDEVRPLRLGRVDDRRT